MSIDWMIVATIAGPVIALFVGAALTRILERRPRIVAYFSHTSAFRIAAANPPLYIHTHAIVIKNTGQQPATDIRVRHNVLPPNPQLFPDVAFTVEDLPGGGADIVIPRLVPGEQVSISYLYAPPLLYSQIHAGIRHSQGFARELTVLPTPQYPQWAARTLGLLIIVGVIAVLYIVVIGVIAAVRRFLAA